MMEKLLKGRNVVNMLTLVIIGMICLGAASIQLIFENNRLNKEKALLAEREQKYISEIIYLKDKVRAQNETLKQEIAKHDMAVAASIQELIERNKIESTNYAYLMKQIITMGEEVNNLKEITRNLQKPGAKDVDINNLENRVGSVEQSIAEVCFQIDEIHAIKEVAPSVDDDKAQGKGL
jgi:hypothetical protein